MHRNWDLVRDILKTLEERDAMCNISSEDLAKAVGAPHREVFEHLQIMQEAGLLQAVLHPASTGGDVVGFGLVQRLTWNGHELLEKMGNETIWANIKSTAKEKGVELSVDLIKGLGAKFLASMFGLSN